MGLHGTSRALAAFVGIAALCGSYDISVCRSRSDTLNAFQVIAMRRRLVALVLGTFLPLAVPPVGTAQGRAVSAADHAVAGSYGPIADSIIRAATRDSAAYTRLGNLVDRFGHRLSGSASLESAID